MNQTFAKGLLLFFLLSGAAFNIAQGRKALRSKKGHSVWGWARIIVGVVMALLPIPLLWFL